MTTTEQRYDVPSILKRADELGIALYIEGDSLKIKAKPGVVTEKALTVIKAHKPAIIDYLRAQPPALKAGPPLCATCMDAGVERPALSDDYEGFMYCAEHHPGHAPGGDLPQSQEKRIEYIDGVRVFIGYSDREWRELLRQEARDRYRGSHGVPLATR